MRSGRLDSGTSLSQVGALVRSLRDTVIRWCPALGVIAYEVFTILNIYSYIMWNSVRLSGEHYFAYEIAQAWINPFVRLPHNQLPVLEIWFYEPILAGEVSRTNFLLYSFWEIVLLDLVLGVLMIRIV